MLSYVKRFGIGDASISCSKTFFLTMQTFRRLQSRQDRESFLPKRTNLSLGICDLKALYSFFWQREDQKADCNNSVTVLNICCTFHLLSMCLKSREVMCLLQILPTLTWWFCFLKEGCILQGSFS